MAILKLGFDVERLPNNNFRNIWCLLSQLLLLTFARDYRTAIINLPMRVEHASGRVAQLSSLAEAAVVDVATREVVAVPLATEPALLALGPAHLAAAVNNQVGLHPSIAASAPVCLQRLQQQPRGVSQ